MGYTISTIDLGGVNSYLIKMDKGMILVDTGGPMFVDKGNNERAKILEEKLEQEGCVPGTLKLIILTHGDCDHSFNARYISKKYKVPIAMHQADEYLVKNVTADAIMKGCIYQSTVYRVIMRLMRSRFYRMSVKIAKEYPEFEPNIRLQDGQSLKEYGLNATIIHIPGHTPGSIAILTNEGDCIVGDTFANQKKPSKALNAVDFTSLNKSVERLRDYSIRKMYVGHGKPYEVTFH